uniref:hypothetical protein n=1 Tax=Treponema sp. TaxID=166 RepID=UPI0025E6FE43
FEKGLKAAAYGVAGDVTSEVTKRLNEKINSSSSEALVKVKEVLGIEGEIDVQSLRMNDLEKILENKKKEFSSATEAAVESAKKEAANALIKGLTGSDSSKSGSSASSSSKKNSLKSLF